MLPIVIPTSCKSTPSSAIADSGDWKSIFVDKSSEHASKDERILQMVEELCRQFGITKLPPKKISWRDTIASGKGSYVVPSDEPEAAGPEVILPARMRDLLEVEDWRPILASSLVYYRKLRGGEVRHLAKRWGLGLIFPLSLFTTLLVVEFAPKLVIGIPGFILLIIILVVIPANYVSAPYVKKMRLMADIIAADKLGKDVFVQVLSKIDRLDMEDLGGLEKRKRLKARLKGRPTMSERIQNLAPIRLGE